VGVAVAELLWPNGRDDACISREGPGESGWVDVMFTVAVDGTVKEVIVRGSTPEDLFVNSAVRAVERWEFEPYTHNGEIVEIQAGVRMMFALE